MYSLYPIASKQELEKMAGSCEHQNEGQEKAQESSSAFMQPQKQVREDEMENNAKYRKAIKEKQKDKRAAQITAANNMAKD